MKIPLLFFLVVWRITTSEPTGCPDMQMDPYTGEYPMMSCLVNHTRTVTKEMSKRLETRVEAEQFVANAPAHIRETMKILELENEQ